VGVLALNDGRSVPDVCGVLRVSVPPVYNWAQAWRERGLLGVLSGHVGGAPLKLTAQLLDVAEQMPRQEPLTWARLPSGCKRSTLRRPPSAWTGCRWVCVRGACRSSETGCRSKK
jgi:transposase